MTTVSPRFSSVLEKLQSPGLRKAKIDFPDGTSLESRMHSGVWRKLFSDSIRCSGVAESTDSKDENPWILVEASDEAERNAKSLVLALGKRVRLDFNRGDV